MKKFLVYSEELGVYLGSCMGMGFWSKLDPVGQESAPVFDSEEQAKDFMAEWESQPPEDTRLVPVELSDDAQYATMFEIQSVGLPLWNIDIEESKH